MDTTPLFGALLFVGGAHALWWKLLAPREGKTYHHSYTEWFLANRELHTRELLPFDERLVELDFFDRGQEEEAEPSIVVDYNQLMGVTPQVTPPPETVPLPELRLPVLGEVSHEQAIIAVKLQAEVEDDFICDVVHSDIDEEPSIVVDYAALGLTPDGDRAIKLDPTMDDGTEAMEVTVHDVVKVYKEPEQLVLGL